MTESGTVAPDPFSLEGFQAQPRLTGITATPDGTRAVVGVSSLNADGTKFVGALWAVDTAGGQPARRLTRSSKGESSPRFTPDGDLLFVSARPLPPGPSGSGSGDDDPASLWLLPGTGGEARPVVTRSGGVGGFAVAPRAGTVVVVAPALPGSADEAADAEAVEDRRSGKISAILHEGVPVRYWDQDLGAAQNRLFVAVPGENADETWTLRDLTGPVGHALDHAAPDVSPDGSTVVTTWAVPEVDGATRSTVVAVDVVTGAVRTLADDDHHEFDGPRVSPNGTSVAMLREGRTSPTVSPTLEVVVVPLAGGPARVLTTGWDGWAYSVRWTPDSAALVVHADLGGRSPLFRVPVDGSSAPERLTVDHGAYPDFEPLADGRIVALRNAWDAPPAPVVVADDGTAVPLPGPAAPAAIPGRLEEIEATAEDGTPLRAWLALPAGASTADPVPLVLWVHGGPLSSWNSWSWRWNPWLLTTRGYAVLLPDPALSTGYGQAMIDRGWGAWGGAPFTDVMALTDAAEAHEAVDPSRTSMMGGSFGGYMANWIAGHTDRFAAIVSHASLWNLDTFGATTDAPWYWGREMSQEFAHANSPHRFAAQIVTPMLVVHGDKDYRVPIGEGLALWWALHHEAPRAAGEDGDTPPAVEHKFLYYPDENHWVLTPHHAELWYETVFAFLDHHVRGEPWVRPTRLG
ncbi:S9 family peptidase [Jatrophihabitans sp. YIM 134969]